ncbi:MAG: hypothetical protein ACR2KG_06325 [Nocardioidaceae bacterium]
MSGNVRRFLVAHSFAWWAIGWLTTTGVVILVGDRVFAVDLVAGRPKLVLPCWELLPLLFAAATPAILAPRLWSWEVLGRRAGIRALKVILATTGIILPAMIPGIASLASRLHGAHWSPASWNVAFVGSIAFAAAAGLGRIFAAPVALSLFAVAVTAQQAGVPGSSYVPLNQAMSRPQSFDWVVALVAVFAVAVWSLTFGRSRFAQSLSHHDSD